MTCISRANEHEQFRRFEEMGDQNVRLLLETKQLNRTVTLLAVEWLAPKDQELVRLREASQAEQAETARSAKDAAWAAAREAHQANTRATIALIIATISAIAAIVGMWIVHKDSKNMASAALARPSQGALR